MSGEASLQIIPRIPLRKETETLAKGSRRPEAETFLQGEFGSTGIITPVTFLYLSRTGYIEIHLSLERKATKMYAAIFGRRKIEVYTFIKSETGYQPMLVIDVRTQRANTIRGENVVLVVHIFRFWQLAMAITSCRTFRRRSSCS